MKHDLSHQALFLTAALVILLLVLRVPPFAPIITYAAVFIASSLLFWLLARMAVEFREPVSGLVPVLMLLLVVRLGFLGLDPLGSDDVYRYMWDGRLQTACINPYRYAPEDNALRHLHTDHLPSRVNHPGMKTIYFPLGEWMFLAGYQLSGEEEWGYRILVLLAELATVIGLWLLLKEFSLSPWRVLIYAASPLVVLQFSLDVHVDVFGFPFLVFGLLMYFRKRYLLSLILLGFSLMVKPVALVLLPVLFFDQQGFLRKLGVIVLPVGLMLISFLPYAIGANPFEALEEFSKHWMFNGALFNVLFPLFQDNQQTRLWCFAILAVALAGLTLSTRPVGWKFVMAVLLLLLCSPVAHPWYVGWLVVLLPLVPLTSGLAFAATASLTSITFVTYQLLGVWKDYPFVLLLEYLPVVWLLYFDVRERKSAGA